MGSLLHFGKHLQARVDGLTGDGKAEVTLRYSTQGARTLEALLQDYGQVPLPPYINRMQGDDSADDRLRYQTRYARQTGSVAAPTAGLHFSDALLKRIRDKGVQIATIVLHVGYGTFSPVRTEDIREHRIHREWVEISRETAEQINRTKAGGGRIWAVGTTTARTLEFAATPCGEVQSVTGECGLYIYPGFTFRVIDNLITNFHLPKSSLLFLVSALAGRKRILARTKKPLIATIAFSRTAMPWPS